MRVASRFRSSKQTYRIAKLSQSNQNANSNINNDEPPSWLKTFFGSTVVNAKTNTRTEC